VSCCLVSGVGGMLISGGDRSLTRSQNGLIIISESSEKITLDTIRMELKNTSRSPGAYATAPGPPVGTLERHIICQSTGKT